MFNVNWICWWMLRMSNEGQIERHQTVSYWCYSVHPATRQYNAEATDLWYYSWEFSKMTTLGDRWMFQWSTWRHCLDAAFGVAYLTERLQKFHIRPGKVHWPETLWIGSSQSRRPHSSLMLDRSIGSQHHSLELQKMPNETGDRESLGFTNILEYDEIMHDILCLPWTTTIRRTVGFIYNGDRAVVPRYGDNWLYQLPLFIHTAQSVCELIFNGAHCYRAAPKSLVQAWSVNDDEDFTPWSGDGYDWWWDGS